MAGENFSSRVKGLNFAKVTEITGDDLGLNRVEVTMRDKSKYYAYVVSSFVGENFGSVVIPNVGDQVIVGFLGGHANEPVILGCVNDEGHKPPIKVDKNNEKMLFKFPSGMTLEINNKKDKSQVDIKTSDEHHLTLLDSDGKFVLKNKDGKTSLEVDLKNNKIDIKSEEISLKTPKCSINLKDNVDIKSSSGNVSVEANSNVDFKAKANLNMEATSKATLKGATLEANGSAKTDVKGGMVNIG